MWGEVVIEIEVYASENTWFYCDAVVYQWFFFGVNGVHKMTIKNEFAESWSILRAPNHYRSLDTLCINE